MARKNTTEAPAQAKKPGRIRQAIDVFKETQAYDRSTAPLMVLSIVGLPVVLALVFGAFGHPIYGAFIGLGFGILIAMIILGRKAQKATYAKIEDQPGASIAVMQQISRGWNVEQEPAAFDARSRSMLFRASGRKGIALVSEGSGGGSRKLMAKEVKRMNRMFPNVPVHAVFVGHGEGEVPLPKLNRHLTGMKNELTKAEAGEIGRRLHALPNPVRQAIPKGVDPMRARPNRKAMRGR